MMQTLHHPYDNTAKTAEIMARYRPIAPKPQAASGGVGKVNNNEDDSSSSLPQNIRNSTYLRNVWPQLQARPTRTRKRGRTSLGLPTGMIKRAKTTTCSSTTTTIHGVAPAFQVTASPAKALALQGFVHHHSINGIPQVSVISNLVPLKCGLDTTPVATPSSFVTLPLLPSLQSFQSSDMSGMKNTVQGKEVIPIIDLNKAADVPEELDFIQRLEKPKSPGIITPRAVRPVGSTIIIFCINEYPGSKGLKKIREDVEKEVESYDLPVIVSDSSNKVRMENSAYKELVGQPMCSWLDFMLSSNNKNGGVACKRIGGEVVLQFKDSSVPISSKGFTCRVKIEWSSNGENKSVNAFCEATRLVCTKDYVFEWKFYIKEASDESASNV